MYSDFNLFLEDIESIFEFCRNQKNVNELYYNEGEHLKIDYDICLRKMGVLITKPLENDFSENGSVIN